MIDDLSSPRGSSPYCARKLAGTSAIENPLVHWALDGDGRDSIGGNHLSIEGGDFKAGKYGQALSLDGSGSHAVDEGGADYIKLLHNKPDFRHISY